jgi:hypothetical protein
MVHPAMHEILLPLWLHLVSCSGSGRSGGTLPHKMASQTTLETSSTSMVSLSWCTVRGWGIRAGAFAACSGEMVAAHWVEVVAVEASASGSSDVGLGSSVAASETEIMALVLASVAGSSGVA